MIFKDRILCTFCKWRDFNARYPACKAYPDGVPTEILNNRVDHRKPYKGDGGVTFKFDADSFDEMPEIKIEGATNAPDIDR